MASLQSDNAELRAKLEESRQQLQSNEQMIRWLNQQVSSSGEPCHMLTQTAEAHVHLRVLRVQCVRSTYMHLGVM